MTFLRFEQLLYRTNRQLRGLPSSATVGYSKHGIIRTASDKISYLSARGCTKDKMLRELFFACKRIKDLAARALLAWYGLGFIHRFSDGNGRIGRLSYLILSREMLVVPEENFSLIIDHGASAQEDVGAGQDIFYRRFLSFNAVRYFVNRFAIKAFLGNEFADRYGAIECPTSDKLAAGLSSSLARQENDALYNILHENQTYRFPVHGIITAKLLQEQGRLNEYVGETVLEPSGKADARDQKKSLLSIDLPKLQLDLTLSDVERIFELHEEFKMVELRTLIDIFEFPERYYYYVPQGSKIRCLEFFQFPHKSANNKAK